jgi:dephospho-CoA kinase
VKVFGLTGGIGMGKSTAGRLLCERGVPIVDTDALARKIVEPGQPALEEIKKTFGAGVILPDGNLHREKLADIVFCNPQARLRLESITHPHIRELWRAQIKFWTEENRPMAAVVIPLLFETGAETELDATVCVASSAATQLRRLAERNWTPEQIQQRVAAQWPVEKKIARSNFVIWNEGGMDVLAEQLGRVFQIK